MIEQIADQMRTDRDHLLMQISSIADVDQVDATDGRPHTTQSVRGRVGVQLTRKSGDVRT